MSRAWPVLRDVMTFVMSVMIFLFVLPFLVSYYDKFIFFLDNMEIKSLMAACLVRGVYLTTKRSRALDPPSLRVGWLMWLRKPMRLVEVG